MADETQNNTSEGIAGLFKNMGDKYDQDVRGATSPFRREISPAGKTADNTKSDLISKDKNSFTLLSYQWYPSDIRRRFADDYYNNIEVAYAKAQNATRGGFLNNIKDAAIDKINAISNTIEDSINQIGDSVNNIKDMINGKKKQPTVKSLTNQFNDYILTFPYAKVYEFKPQDALGATVSTLASGFKMIDTIVDGAAGFKPIVDAIIEGIREFIIKQCQVDIKNISQITDPNFRIYGLPNALYRNLISGYYTGYYEIPILENGEFLQSNGSNGWKQQGFVERFFGDTAGSTIKTFMADNIGSGLDIATRPKWSIEGGGDPFKTITIKVMLFNDNLLAAFSNLAFIHSFVAGNQWYQDTLIQKCSSLYDVELPGRMRYYFCTCDIEVNFVGKTRVISRGLSLDNIILDKKTLRDDLWMFGIPMATLDNMNPYVLNNIPDMYEMTFTFHSLLPNNYNTYYAHLRGDTKDGVQGVGTQIDTISKQLMDSVSAKVSAANEQQKQLQMMRESTNA